VAPLASRLALCHKVTTSFLAHPTQATPSPLPSLRSALDQPRPLAWHASCTADLCRGEGGKGEEGTRSLLPERPSGRFAQEAPGAFFLCACRQRGSRPPCRHPWPFPPSPRQLQDTVSKLVLSEVEGSVPSRAADRGLLDARALKAEERGQEAAHASGRYSPPGSGWPRWPALPMLYYSRPLRPSARENTRTEPARKDRAATRLRRDPRWGQHGQARLSPIRCASVQ